MTTRWISWKGLGWLFDLNVGRWAGLRIQVSFRWIEELCEVVWRACGEFAAGFERPFVVCVADEVEGEVAHDDHVRGAVREISSLQVGTS